MGIESNGYVGLLLLNVSIIKINFSLLLKGCSLDLDLKLCVQCIANSSDFALGCLHVSSAAHSDACQLHPRSAWSLGPAEVRPLQHWLQNELAELVLG